MIVRPTPQRPAELALRLADDDVVDAGVTAAHQPEPIEAVTTAIARAEEHRAMTTSIGTVLALRSITLRTELAGTVRQVALVPGRIADSGVVLVALDRFRADAEGRVHALCHAAPDAWQVMGVMLSAGGALAWLRETIAPDVP